jgi:hypothetical protein
MRTMMAQNLVTSGERIMAELIDRAWEIFRGEWCNPAAEESENNEEFHQRMTLEEIQDIA